VGRASNHASLGWTIWVRPGPKKKIKGHVGLRLAQPKVPGLGPVSWADPVRVCWAEIGPTQSSWARPS